MRNWNLENNLMLMMVKLGFYLTYEELKLGLTWDDIDLDKGDFILPMRNWNIYEECIFVDLIQILSYLWGIET